MECVFFTLPKLGNSEAENEDKASRELSETGAPSFFALSDGATESAFASEWAEELVHSNWSGLLSEPLIEESTWMAQCQASFSGKIDSRKLPWYARTKIDREGAFATFIGLRVEHSAAGGGEWSAIACGDSCLLHIPRKGRKRRFPIDKASGFNNRPVLLSSLYGFIQPNSLRRDDGSWKVGDQLILATDAIAHWLMNNRKGLNRLRGLLECANQQAFEELVQAERALGGLKNDDSTVILIRL